MSVSRPASASENRHADVVLRDGSIVHVRPARNDDYDGLLAFLLGLSERSRFLRFFSAWGDLGTYVDQVVDPDPSIERLDLVATTGRPPRIVGHGTFVQTAPGRAEVAFAVDDAFHGRGLATLLLGQLAEAAHDRGIATFEAVTLYENAAMLGVFRDAGFPVRITASAGEVEVEFPTSIGREERAQFDERDRIASAAAVRTFLQPSSIAVVGASRDPKHVGGALLHHLITGGYTGKLYPVNPHAIEVQSLPAYAAVGDVPGDVELAVIAVPAEHVLEVASQCAEHHVRSLVVISAGFAEVGPDGAQRQNELLALCRDTGMRLVGPNCLGVINTDPAVSMNATFGIDMPSPGHIGFVTQSGGLGLAITAQAKRNGLGVSSFVSNGNKADISGNDLLSYWEEDEKTDVVLMYLESFGNPRKFARVARRTAKRKPIVAVKSGRSTAGARATTSHTGALISSSDVTVDALFKQSGVIRCDTLPELFDVARLFAGHPVPAGPRVAIVTNAGGPGIMCADVCSAEGLDVVEFPDGVAHQLSSFLAREASVSNPVDMIASADESDFRRAIETIAASDSVDSIIAIYIPPFVTRAEQVVATLSETTQRLAARQIPLISVLMAGSDAALADRAEHSAFAFPEDAARALGHAARYGAWRNRAEGDVRSIEVRTEEAAGVIAGALQRGPGWLGPDEIGNLLDCYGIHRVPERVVRTPEQAAAAADEIGFPVALKATGRGIIHKTELEAVRLGLTDAESVLRAGHDLAQRLSGALDGLVVQAMAGTGIGMLIGVVHDELFGPVVAVGAGGTLAELVADVSVRLTPLTEADVAEMIRSLRTFPLLDGYRRAPKRDVGALEDVTHRIGALVEAHHEVAEIDLNPVIVLERGAVVVDARVRVEVPSPVPPLGAR